MKKWLVIWQEEERTKIKVYPLAQMVWLDEVGKFGKVVEERGKYVVTF